MRDTGASTLTQLQEAATQLQEAIEAKDANHSLGHGMQQAQAYAEKLDVPFAISSNGSGLLFSDPHRLVFDQAEIKLALDQLPGPDKRWQVYRHWKGLSEEVRTIIEQPYYDDGSGRVPRYYQMVAVNRTVEAIARGQDCLLLVMATGTGKTYRLSADLAAVKVRPQATHPVSR